MINTRQSAITDEILFRVVNSIELMTDTPIFTKDRSQKHLMTRVFFCNVLTQEYKLMDREISAIFADRGVKYDRSSIYIALTKFQFYLDNFVFMQQLQSKYTNVNYDIKGDLLDIIYDNYDIKDKELMFILNEEMSKLNKSILNTEEIVSEVIVSKEAINMAELTNGLSADQLNEVLDMINLKVKSYSWKSNDRLKVYSGESGAEQQ